jgi:ParB family transcriptional regulator, chromosome partitioning protein
MNGDGTMTDRKPERRGLGRGLSALMADVGMIENAPSKGVIDGVRSVPIEQVRPNPDQPRRHFDRSALEDLAGSIREKGVLQPLLVRDRGDFFEIVAGERRWRAAQMAMLHSVPVLVRDYSDTEVLEVAIIENIQRAELTPVEEAVAFRQLIDRFGHTQEKLADTLGKSRSYIANAMRLLSLPDDVVGMLSTGALSSGHARALVGYGQASKLARRIVDGGLTVRQVENIVRDEKVGIASKPRSYGGRRVAKDDDTLSLEADLSSAIGMTVKVAHESSGSGTLSIRYATMEGLDYLCRVLSAGEKGRQD